jgi:hypothetical protein
VSATVVQPSGCEARVNCTGLERGTVLLREGLSLHMLFTAAGFFGSACVASYQHAHLHPTPPYSRCPSPPRSHPRQLHVLQRPRSLQYPATHLPVPRRTLDHLGTHLVSASSPCPSNPPPRRSTSTATCASGRTPSRSGRTPTRARTQTTGRAPRCVGDPARGDRTRSARVPAWRGREPPHARLCRL